MKTDLLIPQDALAGVDVALSVSESADLGRLGLTALHADQAIAELARGILIAGGNISYGGWLEPRSFTELLMKEVNAHGDGRVRLTLYVALPEHRKLSIAQLDQIELSLTGLARLIYLDAAGVVVNPRSARPASAEEIHDPLVKREAYTSLRKTIADRTHARVLVGGKLAGYQGSMPGILEEAIHSLQRSQPIYVAGGFGGAAAAIVRTLAPRYMGWLADGLPTGADAESVVQSLSSLSAASKSGSWGSGDGLSDADRAKLAASYRPPEIAGLVSVGLSRRFGQA